MKKKSSKNYDSDRTLRSLQNLGLQKLKNAVWHPEFEADAILCEVLKKDRPYLYAHPEAIISNFQFSIFKRLMERRRRKEPFAYLTGQTEFYGSKFKVTPDVLIPRPETEMLVSEALRIIGQKTAGTVADIGTGSGAIIISIAKNNNEKIRYLGIDISSKALKTAKINAKNILNNHRIKFIKGDLLKPLFNLKLKRPLVAAANLPYLTTKEIKRKELSFEPKIALHGGKDGTKLISAAIKQFGDLAVKGDVLILEIGAFQASTIKSLAIKFIPRSTVNIKKDPIGFDRVAIIQF